MFDIHPMRRSIREIFENNVDQLLNLELGDLFFYDQTVDQNAEGAPDFYAEITAPNNTLNATALGGDDFEVLGQLIVEIFERKRADSDGGRKIDDTLGSFIGLVAGQVNGEGVEFRSISFGEGRGNAIYNSIAMAIEFAYDIER